MTDVVILAGWQPGLIGWTVAEHGRYYGLNWDFPASFEAKVAREMAGFVDRVVAGRDLILSARAADGEFLAHLALDLTDPAEPPDVAHLRWFIVCDRARGLGLGERLMQAAMAHLRQTGTPLCYLTTFRGLEAARALYLRHGFMLASEQAALTWGREVAEQRYEWRP